MRAASVDESDRDMTMAGRLPHGVGDAADDAGVVADRALLAGGLVVRDVTVADVDRGEVLRYLGHRGQRLDDGLDRGIGVALERVTALARPRVALRAFAVAQRPPHKGDTARLCLADSVLELEGESVARHLCGARLVVAMVVTTGMGVERELRRLAISGEGLAQLLFDAAATAAVECAADVVESWVVSAARAGAQEATTRFSPGYGDLPLACQAPLLASVDATRRLGVTLTQECLLVPTKSVTAVVGVGPSVRRGPEGGCATCGLRGRCSVSRPSSPHLD